jgi:hypothetical protein
VFLRHHPRWDSWTCLELLNLFPWAFENFTSALESTPVPLRPSKGYNTAGPDPWWVLAHTAYLQLVPDPENYGRLRLKISHLNKLDLEGEEVPPEATLVESTMTIMYDKVQDARDGEFAPPVYGEWSLRVYATQHGLGPWDEGVIAALQPAYRALARWNDQYWVEKHPDLVRVL